MAVVANLHDKRIVELADGEIFNTISYGKGLMQGLRARNVPDRGPLGDHRLSARAAAEPARLAGRRAGSHARRR